MMREGSLQPPGMGGVAPLAEQFEATPPLRTPNAQPESGLNCINLGPASPCRVCPALVGARPVGHLGTSTEYPLSMGKV